MYNSKYCDAQMFKALSLEAHMELHIHMSVCHSVKLADVDLCFISLVCPKLHQSA
jgi:hypothetical protein